MTIYTASLKKGWKVFSAIAVLISFISPAGISSPIFSVDDAGERIDISIDYNEGKSNPEKYIRMMERELRRGNLQNVESIARQLYRINPENESLHEFNAIFLASKGDIKKAREELAKNPSRVGESPYSLYAKSMILRQEGDLDNAIKICTEAISLDTNNPYPLNILGRIYIDKKDYEKARINLQKAITLEPGIIPAYLNLGTVFFLTGDYEKSHSTFQKVLEINSNDYSAHYGLAVIYDKLGRYTDAIREMQLSLATNPENTVALRELVELQIKTENYADALNTAKKMEELGLSEAYEKLGYASLYLGDTASAMNYLNKAPESTVTVQYLKGMCSIVKEDYANALKYMEAVLKKDPGHFGAYISKAAVKLYLDKKVNKNTDLVNSWGESNARMLSFISGNISASQGLWDETLNEWKKSESLIGGFSVAGIDSKDLGVSLKKEEARYITLGVIYYFSKMYNNALDEFEKALRLNDRSFMANYWAAQIYLQKNDSARGIKSLESAVASEPNFFSALYSLGDMKYISGRSDESLSIYQNALKIKKDAGLLIKIGLLHEDTKNYPEAEKMYQEVIDLEPDLYIGYNQLAWLYARRGVNIDRALELANRANTLMPGNASILDTIGWIQYQKKDYSSALTNLKKAEQVHINNPTVLYHIAKVYQATGSKAEARAYVERALKYSSGQEWVNDAKNNF